ncbi:MAG: hypothetical protein QM808_06170 [Steroidobacteraceae bacterium]
MATGGTHKYLAEAGRAVELVNKVRKAVRTSSTRSSMARSR